MVLRFSCAILALCCGWGCAEGGAQRPQLSSTQAAPGGYTPTPGPPRSAPDAAWITLPSGSHHFERDGQRAPLLMRNLTSGSAAGFTPLLQAAHAAGSTLVRVQITQGFGYDTLGIDSSGAVLESWAQSWEAVFDEAERQGLGVIVVFGIWGDWNDGTPDQGWAHFSANPLGALRGGPAQSPVELLQDSEAQRRWLSWVSTLVARWSLWPNISAWELFSELDLVTGATQRGARELLERAGAQLAARDPLRRPLFASTSDLPLLDNAAWTEFWASPSNQVVSVHPYAPDLDRTALTRILAARKLSDKPILIGESGLDAAAPDGSTLTSAAGAEAALVSAIWTELFSGAMNARALYWEDGYAAYYPGTGLRLVNERAELEQIASGWLADKDFSELEPSPLNGRGLFGAALASSSQVLGWARDASLSFPNWQSSGVPDPLIEVGVPAGTRDGAWRVVVTDPSNGATDEVAGSVASGTLSFRVNGAVNALAFEASP